MNTALPFTRRRAVTWLALAAAGCATVTTTTPPPPPLPPPAAPREFRAAWVATVANIDWPSRPGLPAAEQQAEALAIMDRARSIGLNALVLQVRPTCDALYESTLEPWSEFLTGAQGQSPEPAYDPLAFWVQAAHERALELHAWFNPYRARHPKSFSAPAATHISQAQPALVRAYGDLLWLDPGEAQAAEHTLAVVADVVRRYDIDGVHIDDYFYPYPVADQPFPDEASWQRYSGTLSREDWRRANVDALVQRLYDTVHRIKPWVRVGISPFGIGRPDRRPEGISGFSQYDKLYADAEQWLARGWLDYLAPQLYWPIDRKAQAFAVLRDYWAAQNTAGRHLWPGVFTSSIGGATPPWPADEIINQLALLRAHPGVGGHLHFSMIALMQDRDGIATRLAAQAYGEAALVPATPWLAEPAPGQPGLRQQGAKWQITPPSEPGGTVARWAVWLLYADTWRLQVHPASTTLGPLDDAQAVAVRAIGRTGLESPPALLSTA